MAAFTSKATGDWGTAGQTTWNEVGTPGIGDTVQINNAHIVSVTSAENYFTIDIQVGGTLRVDAVAAGADVFFRADDAAGAGIIAASAGALECVGDATDHAYVLSSGGTTPTNYWLFHGGSYTVTADYATFEGFTTLDTSGAVDVDNCAFQYSSTGAARHGVTLRAVTSFTNNVLDNLGNTTTGRAIWFAGNFTGIDNITITNPRFYDIAMTSGRKVERTLSLMPSRARDAASTSTPEAA